MAKKKKVNMFKPDGELWLDAMSYWEGNKVGITISTKDGQRVFRSPPIFNSEHAARRATNKLIDFINAEFKRVK